MNIFQKLSEMTNGSRTYQQVANELERLRKAGKPVTVKFEGDNQTFASRVTAFNQEHRVFVLSNLFPPPQNDTFQQGRTATISSTDNDTTISLKGICLEPLVSGADMGYELKIDGPLSVSAQVHSPDLSSQHIATHSRKMEQERKVVGL